MTAASLLKLKTLIGSTTIAELREYMFRRHSERIALRAAADLKAIEWNNSTFIPPELVPGDEVGPASRAVREEAFEIDRRLNEAQVKKEGGLRARVMEYSRNDDIGVERLRESVRKGRSLEGGGWPVLLDTPTKRNLRFAAISGFVGMFVGMGMATLGAQKMTLAESTDTNLPAIDFANRLADNEIDLRSIQVAQQMAAFK